MMETEGAFTLDVQIYVNTSTPSRIQTVTLCNVLSFMCRCPTCGKSFNSHLTLKAHMKTHIQFETIEEVVADAEKIKATDENYTCVAAVQSGEQHFIFITQDPEVEQNEENIAVNTAVNTKEIRTSKRRVKKDPNQPPARRHPCVECNLAFPTRTKLDIHIRTHTGEKPFVCEECGKRFVTRGELTVHVRVHTGDKPYKCNECGSFHRTRSSLHGHIHRYHQEKAFTCTVCEKKFAIKSYYMAHLRIHDESNPFKCHFCDKAFAYKSFLEKHIKTHGNMEATPEVATAAAKKRKKKEKKAKGKKLKKEAESEDGENSAVTTAEKEKIAVEVLQQGRAAGDAALLEKSSEGTNADAAKPTDIDSTTNPENESTIEEEDDRGTSQATVSSNTSPGASTDPPGRMKVIEADTGKETVFEIETTKNGASETIYVALAGSELQAAAEQQLGLQVLPVGQSQEVEAVLTQADVEGQKIQFVTNSEMGMVMVTEDISGVVIPDCDQPQTVAPQVGAMLSGATVPVVSDTQAEGDVSASEYARRVDAVVQELEKRINTTE